MLAHLFLLAVQLLQYQIDAADLGRNPFKDIMTDDETKASATVMKARNIMAESKFYTFVGQLEGQGQYRLKYLCSYVDSTYIFGIAPKLGCGSTVLGFIEHELFLSMQHEEIYTFNSLPIQLDQCNGIGAYAHTLGLLSSSEHNNLFQGVIFDTGTGLPTINIIFKQDTDPDLIKAFYQSFMLRVTCDFLPRLSVLCFDKVVAKQLQNSWELRVATLNSPLLILDDYEVIVHLFALIHPMLLHDLALVRIGTDAIGCSNDLPRICLQANAMKVDKMVAVTIHNVELKEITMFGCGLSRGLDSIVAISFGVIRVEDSGRNLLSLHLTFDPAQLPDNNIAAFKEAITEMDGYWMYHEKYLCRDESLPVYNKPAVLEYCKNNVPILAYKIKLIEDFVTRASEPWAKEPLQEGVSFRLRHPSSKPITIPFTLIGYATFPKCNLPAIANRIYFMLFVKDAATWIDLVEYVDFKPAKTGKEMGDKFELIVAFQQDPIIDKLNIKELMADIMVGVSGAGNFANGLIKNSDGTIPILQRSTDNYYQERTEDINRRIRYIPSKSKAVEQSCLNDFDAYCVLISATKSICPIGTFTSIFDDTFLECLETENRVANFLMFSQGSKDEMLETFTFEMPKSRLPDFISNLKKWNQSTFPAKMNNVLQMVFIEVPAKDSSDKMNVGLGFGASSPPELHTQGASMLGLHLALSNKTGQMGRPNLIEAPMDPLKAPWSLSFGQEGKRTTRTIEGLTQLHIFISFLNQATLSTVEMSLSGPEIKSDLKIALYLKADYLRCILFEEDIWNMFEGKSSVAMWNELFKVRFSSVPDRPAGEIRAEFFIQPNADLTVLARLLNHKLLRLVLIESYGLKKTNPTLKGQLRVGNYWTKISSTEAFLKSIAHWPKSIGRKDVLSFERTGLVVKSLIPSKSSAIRLVVKAERLQHILAICIETLVDTIGNMSTISSSQLIIRAVKNSPTSAKSNKHKKSFTHSECIWVLPVKDLKEEQTKIFAQLFKVALEIYGIKTHDTSMGLVDTKTLAYTQTQKLTFNDDVLMKELEGYCENVQSPAKRFESKKPEASVKSKKNNPVKKPVETKSTKASIEAEKPAELPITSPGDTTAEVKEDISLTEPASLLSSEKNLSVEKELTEAPVEMPVIVEKARPKVQAIGIASSFITSSRRRIPCTFDFIS